MSGGDDRVRRRKHRSSHKEGSSHRHGSRNQDENGEPRGKSKDRRKSRKSKRAELSESAIIRPIAVARKEDEDVEALDFDPTKDPNDKFSESHKSLLEDPNYIEETMQENIFSLIYISPVCSGAFWFGFIVALFQLALPFLALLDLIVLNDEEGNYLQLPNNVSIQVRVLAGMVLILAVVQFWDLMEALEKLQKGPPPKDSDTPVGAKPW